MQLMSQDILGISLGHLWHIFRISSRHLWDIYGTSSRYLWDISKTSLGYLWDIFKIPLGYLWDILGKSLGYLRDILGISLGYLWDIFGISWGYLGQSVTYRYREFFIFLVLSEPVPEKFGTGKESRNQYWTNLVPKKSLGNGIGKICIGKSLETSIKNLDFLRQNLRWVLVPNRNFSIFGGIGKIWHRKKVSELVSVKFGISRKSRNRNWKNLVPKKVSETVSEKI